MKLFENILSLFKKVPSKEIDLNNYPKNFVLNTSPYTQEIIKIRAIAKNFLWEEISFQPENKMISFTKNDVRLNIYYSTFTVGTCLKHPYKGRTQLFRRNVSWKELEKIFDNPRTHTNKGYYVKT